MGDITWTTLKGPWRRAPSLGVGWAVRRFLPSNHTRSPSLYLGVSLCLTHDFWALIMRFWACARASLNCSIRNVTCGNGDVAFFQSARGLYPIRRKNGDFLVLSLGQLLCANCAIGSQRAQSSCLQLVTNIRNVSPH